MLIRVRIVVAAVVSVSAACPVRAQCDLRWLEGPGLPGVDGTVNTMMAWDPDGPGPLPEELVVCGHFLAAGGVRASNIAAWDGTSWHAFGDGLFGAVSPYPAAAAVLAVYNGELVAGGAFRTAGGATCNSIARWNGSDWAALEGGVGGVSMPAVQALTVFNGELIASGYFGSAGELAAKNIAAWNGSAWHPLSAGVGGSTPSKSVASLAVYHGALYAGYYGTALEPLLAVWDGSDWTSMDWPWPMYGGLSTFWVHDDKLIAGARSAWSGPGDPFKVGSGSWDGSTWQELPTSFGTDEFATYAGRLIAIGHLYKDPGVHFSVGWWDGAAWQPMDEGLAGEPRTVRVFQGKLIVGGSFTSVSGSGPCNLAFWDGASWRAIQYGPRLNNTVNAMYASDSGLFVGGSFTHAGDAEVLGVARWTGAAWESVGTPTPNQYNWDVRALIDHQGHLYAGGIVNAPAIDAAGEVFRLDGESWASTGLKDAAAGVVHSVDALCEFQGDLVAGGYFEDLGNARPGVLRWNGTSWNPIGDGLSGTVLALTVFQGDLIAGGTFDKAGGIPAPGVARWNGAAWSRPGDLSGTVYALVRFESGLVAAGKRIKIGSKSVGNIARWDGAKWYAMDAGLTGPSLDSNYVHTLAVHDGQLYAAGSFTKGNTTTINQVARWDGVRWEPVGSGVMGADVSEALALASYHGELCVGGNFSLAGSGVSAHFARWTDTGIPWIAQQPSPISTACGQTATFSAAGATGYAPLTYQWRRGGVNLTDGPTGTGSSITGANSATLHIAGTSSSDNDLYDCIISNTCGAATSESANLIVTGCCPADFDDSGFVNGDDFDSFVIVFESGSLDADFDHNGFVNGDDYDLFVAAFVEGC